MIVATSGESVKPERQFANGGKNEVNWVFSLCSAIATTGLSYPGRRWPEVCRLVRMLPTPHLPCAWKAPATASQSWCPTVGPPDLCHHWRAFCRREKRQRQILDRHVRSRFCEIRHRRHPTGGWFCHCWRWPVAL